MARKATIAIVNNERNLVISLRMCLKAQGYAVRDYGNTADALELLDHPADLAYIDKTNRRSAASRSSSACAPGTACR